MNKQTQKLFTDLLSLPTAPYKEGAVSAFIQAFAKKRGLTLKADKYGNLVVRYTHGKDPKPVALTAHMDHPGFEVLEATGRDLKARWLGGCVCGGCLHVPRKWVWLGRVGLWRRRPYQRRCL